MQVVYTWGSILTVILIPIWPLLALAAGVFPKVSMQKLAELSGWSGQGYPRPPA